jgi:dynein heavy chain, axonemal
MQTIPPYKVPVGGKLTDLIIPTIDSVRNNYLFSLFISMKSHLLLTGPTGTGKTVNVINEIITNYHNEQFTNLITAFSG